jgi:two-component system NarL family sensor kinase
MDKETNDFIFTVIASSSGLAVLSVLVVNLLLVGRNRRLKHQAQVLEMKSNYEKELMKTQVEVAENTLNDIARDLHDDVGQMLTFSIIQLNNLKETTDASLENKIMEVRASVQNTLQSVRGISKTLSSDYISSFGIYESLQRLFERLNKQGIIKSTLHFSSTILFRSRSNELFAFRIIQELVNNTVKHAEATKIILKVSEEDNSIRLEYQDNGKGIPKGLLKQDQLKNSLGFTNIYKRAELMKGNLEFRTDSGEGFYLQLRFPNE